MPFSAQAYACANRYFYCFLKEDTRPINIRTITEICNTIYYILKSALFKL